MDINNIKALAEIVNQNGLTKLEISEGELKIKIEKASPISVAARPEQGSLQEPELAPAQEANAAAASEDGAVDFNHIKEVKSPIVGVFYSAPSPESQPFVTIGSKVKKGDVLCIIEAMKLMNEITAEEDGEIVDICVKNGEIAEFGQTLFKIY